MFNALAQRNQRRGIAPANLRMATLCIVRTVTAYPIDELIRGNLGQQAGLCVSAVDVLMCRKLSPKSSHPKRVQLDN
jgi:hypothetical protein